MTLTIESLQRHPMMRGVRGLESLVPHFESMNMERGQYLNTDKYIYFPVTARFGVHELVQEKQHIEITPVYPGEATTIVQHLEDHNILTITRVAQGGLVFRILTHEFMKNRVIQLMYNIREVNQVGMIRVLKILMCTLEHKLEQRVARYLLTQHSRNMYISQQDIANAIGCRREGVTEAFQPLVKGGAITHNRDHVSLNFEKLSHFSCECEKHIFPWSQS